MALRRRDGGCVAGRRKHLEAERGENRWEKRIRRNLSVWEQPITDLAFHADPNCCLLHNVMAPLSKLDALTSLGTAYVQRWSLQIYHTLGSKWLDVSGG